MDTTLDTANGRTALRVERKLAHPPEKVWRSLTDPDRSKQWFPAAMITEDLRVGGEIKFRFEWEEEPGTRGVITELDPPRVFAFTWDHDLLRWEIRPHDGATLLVLTHVFDDRPAAASYAAGWEECLDALESVLDGKPWQSSGKDVERHETFVEAFGLDEGTAESTPDGWRVRFERQTRKPVDEVWAALLPTVPAAGDPITIGDVSGTVTAVEPPTVLGYDAGQGRVHVELSDGPGGARLVVVHTGPSDPDEALAAWKSFLRQFAKRVHAKGSSE